MHLPYNLAKIPIGQLQTVERLIQASNLSHTLKQLSPGGDIRLPVEERGARELLKLSDPQKMLKTLQKANELAGACELRAKYIRKASIVLGFVPEKIRTQSTRKPKDSALSAVAILNRLRRAIEKSKTQKSLLRIVDSLEEHLLR